MKLWRFDLDDGEQCYSSIKPPGWSENMEKAVLVDAPDVVAAEFARDAQETFRKEYGAPLHSVILYADGSIKRNARVC